MSSVFHEGERVVQLREGVAAQARRLGGLIKGRIEDAARDFLEEQERVMVASVDPTHGHVWCSLLTGPPGFARAASEETLLLEARPELGDPAEETLCHEGPIGVLAIDLATRRRAKLKGRVQAVAGGYRVTVERVFALCPKYIQAREPIVEDRDPVTPAWFYGARLTTEQQRWIAGADTAVIATFSAAGGADASHRGGAPGFVRVVDDARLELPDYAGNNIFNALGNLELDGRAGLLFLDFERGRTLQLTGRASATWSPERLAVHPGARRLLDFTIERVVEVLPARPVRWRFLEASRFNPR